MFKGTLLVPTLALVLAACGQTTPETPAAATQRSWAAWLDPHLKGQMVQEGDLYGNAVRADWLADRPEMQDPEALALLNENWQDPDFLSETEAPYSDPESPVQPPNGGAPVAMQSLVSPQVCALSAVTCPPPDADPQPPAPAPQPPGTPGVLDYVKGVAWGTVDNYNREYANQAAVNSLYPGQLDWGRDACSVPRELALTYRSRFAPACNVHDFGYRNIPRFERTAANRERTDKNFLGNMRDICHHRPWQQRPFCRAAAWTYYQGVRLFGEKYW